MSNGENLLWDTLETYQGALTQIRELIMEDAQTHQPLPNLSPVEAMEEIRRSYTRWIDLHAEIMEICTETAQQVHSTMQQWSAIQG